MHTRQQATVMMITRCKRSVTTLPRALMGEVVWDNERLLVMPVAFGSFSCRKGNDSNARSGYANGEEEGEEYDGRSKINLGSARIGRVEEGEGM